MPARASIYVAKLGGSDWCFRDLVVRDVPDDQIQGDPLPALSVRPDLFRVLWRKGLRLVAVMEAEIAVVGPERNGSRAA